VKKPIPFGKYYLMDRVAVGGMAEVFKAKTVGAEGFSKIVALKRILPNIAEDNEFINMFIDEAKIAVQLSHANVAQILELGEDQGTYFIAMEYVQGKDLRTIFERAKRLEESRTISPLMAAYIISRVCEGLDYAHRKKDDSGQPLRIVHRDVSPQNILVSYDGDVKLIDFGVAKAQNKMTRTQAGILKGKFSYMSPEQVQGVPLDQRSDIFSLGIVLHEILVGERLFVGKSDFQTLEKVRKAEATLPSESNPEVPPELDDITMKALSRDPETRYHYASEMHEDLQRFLYSRSPVYSRKDLAGYMKQYYQADFDKEMTRQTAYDPFFVALQNGTLPPDAIPAAVQQPAYAPTGSFQALQAAPPAAPPPQHSSFAGAMPTGHGSHSGAQPHPHTPQHAEAMAGPPSPYAPHSQQNMLAPTPQAFQPDNGDSTMLDPNGGLGLSPLQPGSSSTGGLAAPQPQFNPQGFLQGDHLPGAPPPAASSGYYDEYEEEGESDTIIDLSIQDEPSGNNKRTLMIIAGVVVLLAIAGTAAMFFLKDQLFGPKKPKVTQEEFGKYTLVFDKPQKQLTILINGKEFPAKQTKKVGQNRIELLFPKAGSFSLEIRKAGHQALKKRIFVSLDLERETPPLMFRKQTGTVIIASSPSEAVVKINGAIQSKATPGSYTLPFGTYQFRIVTKGRKPWTKRITVEAGKTTKLNLKLEKLAKATLQVLCNQGQARVYINGRYRGKVDSSPKNYKLRFNKTHRLKVVPIKHRELTFKLKTLEFPVEPLRIVKVHCVPPTQRKQKGFVTISSLPASIVQINQAKINRGNPITRARIPLFPGRYKITFTHPKTRKQQVYDVDIHKGEENPGIIVTWPK
jgi:serine/threonine protein kinase